MKRSEQIEEACTAVATALAELVAAFVEQARTGESYPAASIRPKIALQSAINGSAADKVDHHAKSRRIYVYMAGSRGCANLAQTYGKRITAALGINGTPYVIKVGTTTLALPQRMRQIGQDKYGAAVRTLNGVEIEPGFTNWIAHTIATSRQPLEPAIALMPRYVAVDLPPGLTRRGFDTGLQRALKGRALTSISDRVVPRRYVAYDLVETRVSKASELYALSPHDSADGDLLLDAIEGILHQVRSKPS